MKRATFAFRTASGAVLGAALVLVAAGSVQGQQIDDTRWIPWFGCWEPIGEVRAESAVPLLCVGPAEGGVRLESVLDGEVVASELIRSDGTERPVELEGCEGWEKSSFSEDGRRVFLDSEQMCEGDFGGRTSSVIAMTSPFEWVDIQVTPRLNARMLALALPLGAFQSSLPLPPALK